MLVEKVFSTEFVGEQEEDWCNFSHVRSLEEEKKDDALFFDRGSTESEQTNRHQIGLVRWPDHVKNQIDLLDVVFTGKQRSANKWFCLDERRKITRLPSANHFSQNTTDRPDIDRLVITSSIQHDFRCAIPTCCHLDEWIIVRSIEAKSSWRVERRTYSVSKPEWSFVGSAMRAKPKSQIFKSQFVLRRRLLGLRSRCKLKRRRKENDQAAEHGNNLHVRRVDVF